MSQRGEGADLNGEQVTSGTTMNLTLTGATTPCDSKQPGAQLKTDAAITFTKQ
jgi:hypothetical protein